MPTLTLKIYSPDDGRLLVECANVGCTLDGAVYWILRSLRVEIVAKDAEYKRPIINCTLSDLIAVLTDPDKGFHQ